MKVHLFGDMSAMLQHLEEQASKKLPKGTKKSQTGYYLDPILNKLQNITNGCKGAWPDS